MSREFIVPWAKRCPFCREEKPRMEESDGWYRIECVCGAQGPVFGDEEKSPADNKKLALEAWNKAKR